MAENLFDCTHGTPMFFCVQGRCDVAITPCQECVRRWRAEGKRFRQIRLEAGAGLRECAKQFGVRSIELSRAEQGMNALPSAARDMLEALPSQLRRRG